MRDARSTVTFSCAKAVADSKAAVAARASLSPEP